MTVTLRRSQFWDPHQAWNPSSQGSPAREAHQGLPCLHRTPVCDLLHTCTHAHMRVRPLSSGFAMHRHCPSPRLAGGHAGHISRSSQPTGRPPRSRISTEAEDGRCLLCALPSGRPASSPCRAPRLCVLSLYTHNTPASRRAGRTFRLDHHDALWLVGLPVVLTASFDFPVFPSFP